MAVFNYAKKEIDAKIVYYGPAISGKTTNLQFIHGHMKPDQRGKMVSLAIMLKVEAPELGTYINIYA